MSIYVGLDVHSKQTSYCVQNSSGKVLSHGELETSEAGFAKLIDKIKAPVGTPIAMETGAQAKWLSHLLSGLKMKPIVIDAKEVRQKSPRRGQKSDSRDAFEICDGLRRNQWTRIVWIPPAEIENLRVILARRRHFIRVRTSQVNAAKFLLRSLGIRLQSKHLGTEHGWQAVLARPDVSQLTSYLKMHFELWKTAEKMIQALERELTKALKPHKKTVDHMTSVYGIGPITAATMIAALGTPDRFASSNKVVSYLGCAPTMYDSGERQRRGGITKEGPAYVRAVLCEAGQQARRITHPLHPYWARLAAKSGKNPATMAIAARLARILWRIWRDDTPFDLAKLNVVYNPSIKTKRSYYEIKQSAR